MDDFEILVDPGTMLAKADDILEKIQRMTNRFSQVEQCVSGTESYWRGDAAERYRKNYLNSRSDVEEMMRGLTGRVDSLRTIAGNYQATVRKIQEVEDMLTANMIS